MGFSVIDFATDMLGIDLFPWQRWLLIHALELRREGGFRFRTVLVLVARQNGKSLLSQVLALWFMYVYGFNLVLGTAQDLDTAEEIWQGAVDLVTEVDDDDEPVRPELLELWSRTVMVNGKKSLELKTGARYKAKAASRRAGRGLSGDLVMLDELREHQSWDAWGAITKTTMARDEAMIWALSNAGDELSVVLGYLRKLAHATVGDPDGICAASGPAELPEDVDVDSSDDGADSVAIFEWSAAPGCRLHDREQWAKANPSLGYAITERTVAAAVRTDPEEIFRTEVLCQWVGSLAPPAINLADWEDRRDPESRPLDPVVLGLEVSSRRVATISVAGWRADGRVHGEQVWSGPAAAAVAVLLQVVEMVDPAALVLDGGGYASSLLPEIRAAQLDPLVLTAAERSQADEGLAHDVEDDRLRLPGEPMPEMDAAAEAATWRQSREKRYFAGAVKPLVALSLARFGLLTVAARPPEKRTGGLPEAVHVDGPAASTEREFDVMSVGF